MSIIRRVELCELSYNGEYFLLPSNMIVKEKDLLVVISVNENILKKHEKVEVLEVLSQNISLNSDAFEALKAGDTITVISQSHDLKDPQSLQWDISDFDGSSGRNQMGTFFRDRIVSKRTLSCTWGPLNNTEMAELLSMMEDVFFKLDYPDALTGDRRVGEFYVGNRTTPMMRQEKDGTYMWQNVSATFIER